MRLSRDLDALAGMLIGPYHLDTHLMRHPSGPLYQATNSAAQTACLVRLLSLEDIPAPAEIERLFARFLQLSAPLRALQHPYLLPLLDAGVAQGVAYLVYPNLSTRPLRSRIDRNVPLDLLTIGRYLDQLAGALEYAHEHRVYHGALTLDSIFIQRDGRLLVADCGVVQLFASVDPEAPRRAAYRDPAAVAPEQLLGQPPQASMDVFGLGNVLYTLLTGQPAFTGPDPDTVARHVLYDPAPAPQALRPDLPAELDALVKQALAKTPEKRFSRPGILANAYHSVVSPNNASRVPFASAIAPEPLPQTRAREDRPAAGAALYDYGAGAQNPPPPPLINLQGIPYPTPAPRFRRARLIGGVVVTLIALLSVAALIAQNRGAGAAHASGQVHFYDNGARSNSVRIALSGLAAPPAGQHYQAWLINTTDEEITFLGDLTLQGAQAVAQYTSSDGTNLLAHGNVIEVTQEKTQAQAPGGKVVLSGAFPPKASIHIGHLLVSFPVTPNNIGLLNGLLAQTRAVATEAHTLATSDAATARCTAQAMLDIIEGAKGANAHALNPHCPALDAGDGYGLLAPPGATSGGYLEGASDHAALAVQQPDATAAMHAHGAHVTSNLDDMTTTAKTLDADLSAWLNAPAASAAATIAGLADRLYQGGATPDNAKSGALYAYAEAQAMVDVTLAPGANQLAG
jgi:hypothetical protein